MSANASSDLGDMGKDLESLLSNQRCEVVDIEYRANGYLTGPSGEAAFLAHAFKDVEALLDLQEKMADEVREYIDAADDAIEAAEAAELEAVSARESVEARLEDTEKLLKLAEARIEALESAAAAKPVTRTRKKASQ